MYQPYGSKVNVIRINTVIYWLFAQIISKLWIYLQHTYGKVTCFGIIHLECISSHKEPF